MAKRIVIFCSLMLLDCLEIFSQKGLVVNNAKVIVTNGAILSVTGAGDADVLITNNGKLAIDGSVNITGDVTNNGQAELDDGDATNTGSLRLMGSTEQRLGGTATSVFENLVLNNSSIPGIILDNAIQVSDELDLTDGIMYTSDINPVQFIESATTVNHSISSFVDGPAQKIGNNDFTFPTGDGVVWAPLRITSLTGDAATIFTAEFSFSSYSDVTNFKDPDPNGILNNVSTLEYWDLSNTGTPSNANLTLYWKDQSRTEIDDYDDLVIAHYTGVEWENLGQDSREASDPGSITVNNVSSFSPFTFGSVSASLNPLPVELISFTGEYKENAVELNWVTASELDNDHFEIERSLDGIEFEAIGLVPGKGTSNVKNSYRFYDDSPVFGIVYYRLKQVDYDGGYEFSKIIYIEVPLLHNIKLTVYPNPFENEAIISYYLPKQVKVRIIKNAITGNQIEILVNEIQDPGSYNIPLSDPNIGIMTLHMDFGGNVMTKKIIRY